VKSLYTKGFLLVLLSAFLFMLANASSANAAFTAVHPAKENSALLKGKSPYVPDPKLLARKLAGLVKVVHTSSGTTVEYTSGTGATAMTTAAIATTAPTSYLLNTSWTDTVYEPYGQGYDAAGKYYVDSNMWSLCGPGASAVALAFWLNTAQMGTQSFYDYKATTTWNDTNHQAYLMYLATKTQWPTETGVPGEIYYDANGNSQGTYYGDLVNALNWNASGHGTKGAWQGYFYIANTAVTASNLNSEIVSDIGVTHVPAVALVQAADLPDWHGNAVGHYIAITGYDNNAGTYTYAETCGPNCGGQWGHHTISQSGLLTAIINGGGVFVW